MNGQKKTPFEEVFLCLTGHGKLTTAGPFGQPNNSHYGQRGRVNGFCLFVRPFQCVFMKQGIQICNFGVFNNAKQFLCRWGDVDEMSSGCKG